MQRRFFEGRLGSRWRQRISKPGFDARTAPDGSTGIAFDSDYAQTLPIFYRVAVIAPSPSVNQFNVPFPSTLSYIPLCTLLMDNNNWGDLALRGGLRVPDRYLSATRDFVFQYQVAYCVFADRVRVDGLTSESTGVTLNIQAGMYLGDLIVFAVPSGA